MNSKENNKDLEKELSLENAVKLAKSGFFSLDMVYLDVHSTWRSL